MNWKDKQMKILEQKSKNQYAKNITLFDIENSVSSYFEDSRKNIQHRNIKLYCMNQAAFDAFNKALREEFEKLEKHLNQQNDKRRKT